MAATGATEVVVVTAALTRNGSPQAALRQAAAHFRRAGAGVVDAGLTRPGDARRPEVLARLGAARLVYLLGGDPGHLLDTVQAGGVADAFAGVLSAGGGLAGSSAGAMVMGRRVLLRSRDPRPASRHARDGLGLVDATLIPHAESVLEGWLSAARREAPGENVLALDEQTGVVFGGGSWTKFGPGEVRWFEGGEPSRGIQIPTPHLV